MDASHQKLLQLYGKFIVEFELVCSRIRFVILILLFPQYDEKQKNLVEIMTEGLTADPLRKKLLALVIEQYSCNSEMHVSVEKISKIFIEMIQIRNSFAHGTAFVGQYDFIGQTSEDAITLRHPKLKKDGLDLNFRLFDVVLLQNLIEILMRVSNALSHLGVLIRHNDKDENFKRNYYNHLDSQIQFIAELKSKISDIHT